MMVKVLDENRVKILMEDQDIAYYDLPFEKLSDEDPESRAFLYDLIRRTYERTGIDFNDCRVMIEVIPGVSASYYILLTRIKGAGDDKIQFDKAESIEREIYIYKLDRAWDTPLFFRYLQECPPDRSALYYYDDAYYAILFFTPAATESKGFKRLLSGLEEFGGRCRYRYINEGILREWGKCLCKEGAYETFISG